MATLTLNGSTSGYVIVTVPPESGANTITFPAATGTVLVNNSSSQTLFPDGTVSAPSISNDGDPNTGIYFPAADNVAIATGGVAALTADSSQNVSVTNTLVMGSSFKRNRIINGNMQVWQRATAPTAGALSSFTYNSVDRWSFYSGSTSATISQDTSVPTGFQYSLKLQRTAASTGTGPFYAQQIVETVNCLDLSGQTITLSFYAKAGANFSATSNLITVQVNTGTVADQGGNSGAWTGAATALNTSQAITTTWTRYSFTGTVASNVLEIAAVFGFGPTGTAGADDSVYITGVQLEVGSVATPYERQIYSDQLAQCQRYYWKMVSGDAKVYTLGAYYSSSYMTSVIQFPVTMRTAPTLDATSGTNYYAFYANSSADLFNSVSLGGATPQGTELYNNSQMSGTAGQSGFVQTNNAAASIAFSAEL